MAWTCWRCKKQVCSTLWLARSPEGLWDPAAVEDMGDESETVKPFGTMCGIRTLNETTFVRRHGKESTKRSTCASTGKASQAPLRRRTP